MANTFLSYRDQVKRIKEKGASCECKNETQCKIEENLEKLLQTNNYTRVFTPLKHTFLDIEQQELNQQVKIFNDETKKTLFNETSTLHEKYRNLFKQDDEHKYRVGNKFFSIDFIIKTYSYDKEMQLKMWDIINNFEVILKTNVEKCNNIESIIEHNGKKIMLYSFYNKITTIHKKLIQTQASGTQTQVFRTQTQVFEKDLEKFTSEILKFGTKLN
ncbi:hypothetical protein [Mesomycoplasma bovoculi]|uniref:Uncharacterized protein n=1 Tax=Mesomycoplasma bovoculi M165/69 TaxID=743966 RepID=W5UTI9_9BACT|nr:hypothetical protein [Mesomycoplasma bovoculi]AHH45554.1 hypothetical protein MYB_02775 [Mesomycoplasma bovoculi M165/69]